jgi:HAD superfamily hydrolase (TIGR01509 family)
MDGTLLDSEPLWSAAARRLAEGQGRPWSTFDDREIVGWSIPAVAAYLRGRGVGQDEDEIVDQLHACVGAAMLDALPWRDGAFELLTLLQEADVPVALVTMTYRRLADLVVRAAPPGTIQVLVTGDDVKRGKPHPEAYRTAAQRLGVDARECVAVEDSPTGIASALASGAWTYAVDPAQPTSSFRGVGPLLECVDGLGPVIAGLRQRLGAPVSAVAAVATAPGGVLTQPEHDADLA